MRTLHLLASLTLIAALGCGQALAQEAAPEPSIVDPLVALEARDAWLAEQVVVRSAMRLDVLEHGQEKTKTFLMFVERTPHGRSRVAIKDTAEGKTLLTFLVHDNSIMAIEGDEVFNPGTAWMLGYYLFNQALEPAMLLNWSMGLPGKEYSVNANMPEVNIQGEAMAGINQAGWQVGYGQWAAADGDRPALPRQLRLMGEQAEVVVSVLDFEAHTTAPEGYHEFKIM